jgi:adenylate cyclase class 2
MLEVEAKFPVADFAAVEERLRAWGARHLGDRTDTDCYYTVPGRDLKQTGEVFRLRRIGEASCVTYKGPRRAGPAKTRPEIEVPLAPGLKPAADLHQIFTRLGFGTVAVVAKRRRVYEWERGGFTLEACLDELDGVGRFVELEALAEESQVGAAEGELLRVAAELGLSAQEKRSYLEMYLQSQRGAPTNG